MHLIIKCLSTFHICKHPLIGEINSGCDCFSADFYSGINFVFGDVFDNGWACTYAMCMGHQAGIIKGEFYINESIMDIKSLRKLTYYVGFDELIFLKKVKLKKVLNWCKYWKNEKDGIYKNMKLEEIDSECKIMNRKFEQMGHWIYFCSCLVGIAKGKKIFCFPWIDAKETLIQSYRFNLLAKYAQENDIIIIIPTSPLDEQAKHQIEYSYNYVIG